jgi:hypothetical protein
MRTSTSIGLVLTLAGSLTFLTTVAKAGCNDPDLDTVRDRVLADCPCNGNHGQYVSCIAHEIRTAVASGELDVNCKGAVVRCAARSTCGHKTGFVACTICNPGTCTDGLCDDGVTACTDSTQCAPVVDRCSTKSSADHCVVPANAPAGSTAVAGSGSCCQASCTP